MNVVRLADTKPQPWRNGGGSTRELLTWPTGEDWALRISVATITRDGEFSAWPGVDRWFAVVEGAGVRLTLPEGEIALSPRSAPLRFGGELMPWCRLHAGPTLDLNLMLRRSAGSGELRRARPGSTAPAGTPWRALYTADALALELDGALMPVGAGTLLWLQSAEPVGWQLPEDAPELRAWWMSWRPA